MQRAYQRGGTVITWVRTFDGSFAIPPGKVRIVLLGWGNTYSQFGGDHSQTEVKDQDGEYNADPETCSPDCV